MLGYDASELNLVINVLVNVRRDALDRTDIASNHMQRGQDAFGEPAVRRNNNSLIHSLCTSLHALPFDSTMPTSR